MFCVRIKLMGLNFDIVRRNTFLFRLQKKKIVMNNNTLLFRPVDPAERIVQIDVLRGFALFGVLLVNVFGYNASLFDFSGFYNSFGDVVNSKIFYMLVNFAADKFIFIFSFLFGVSFSIMYEKNRSYQGFFFRLWSRRMLALAMFGIIDILFFWPGDILLMYSIMGMILFAFRKLSLKLLLILSVVIYFLPVFYIGLQSTFTSLPDALSSVTDIKMPEVIKIYSSGSFSEIVKLRIAEFWAFRYINLIYYAPKVLALFMAGYWFFRKKVLETVNNNKKRFLITALVLFLTGILVVLYTENIVNGIVDAQSKFSLAVYMAVYEITNLLLGSSYILFVIVLSQMPIWHKLLSPLKYMGRTALTNYLMQSVIFSVLMCSYGFGMFGSFEPWQLVILAVIVFVVQIIISGIWLKRFRFGPMEWLWRKFTYGAVKISPYKSK